MKIDYAWTVRGIIENIAIQSQIYRTWTEGYWDDGVRSTLVKNSEAINEKAVELQKSFQDISSLTDKFVGCKIDELEDSAYNNYFKCKQLESEIAPFKVESDAFD